MSAVQGGGTNVEATAPSPANWETFNFIRNPANPSMVHIQASNGMYLQVCMIDWMHFSLADFYVCNSQLQALQRLKQMKKFWFNVKVVL